MLSDESGLTLIELCLTLLLLGLFVAAASPDLSHALAAMRLKSEAESVAADMRMASQKSRISGVRRRMLVAEDGSGYVIERQTWEDTPDTPAWEPPADWHVTVQRTLRPGSQLKPAGQTFVLDPGRTRTGILLTYVHDGKTLYEIRLVAGESASVRAPENARR